MADARKFDGRIQFKCYQATAAEFQRIIERNRLDGPEILRELLQAFIDRFGERKQVEFPLIVLGGGRALTYLLAAEDPGIYGNSESDHPRPNSGEEAS